MRSGIHPAPLVVSARLIPRGMLLIVAAFLQRHYGTDAATFADWGVSYLKVDFCGFHGPFTFKEWMDPTIQLKNWQDLRDALNRTGKAIYYSICPHSIVPPTGTSEPWYKNGSGLVYAPPLSWTAADRKGVANSLLVEVRGVLSFCLSFFLSYFLSIFIFSFSFSFSFSISFPFSSFFSVH